MQRTDEKSVLLERNSKVSMGLYAPNSSSVASNLIASGISLLLWQKLMSEYWTQFSVHLWDTISYSVVPKNLNPVKAQKLSLNHLPTSNLFY